MELMVDIIGPLHLTTCGNRYIAVATDYFSKWPEACALPNKNATSVANFLYSLYCRYGAGDIITDQGWEFVSQVQIQTNTYIHAWIFSMTCRLLMFYAKHSKWTTGLHQHIIHNPMGYVKG